MAGPRSLSSKRLHALAAAVAVCASLLPHGAAQALTLGRIEVQSAQGEALRAEIDLLDITAEEAASLRVRLAPEEMFSSAGLALNPALSGMQVSLEKRENGRLYLRLSTPDRVTDAFVDVILEVQWSSGRLLRDYALLLDPVRNATAAHLQPLAPVTTPSSDGQSAPSQRGAEEVASSTSRRVEYGDTASRLAADHRQADASLDQILVAMLRGNPAAFVDGNVNRMKAGALVEMPTAPEAQAIAPGEARQIIAAQSRDFNEFRRRLAGGAPVAAPETDERQSSGQVQGAVQEQQNASTPVDKLLLSKGALAARDAEEDRIAQQRQANDTATRVAELSRNIEELAQLRAAAAGSAASSPVSNVLSPTEASAALAGPALTTTLPSSAPDSLLIASLIKEPLAVPVAGGLLALLAALGFLVSRGRRQHHIESQDSSFFQSRQEPAPYFASGSERVAAVVVGGGREQGGSPQDALDVDPLAEADVYLAYGRDMQAEEILREALPGSPHRLAIILKLLEIHARRRDTEGFEALALDARELTQAQGPQWAQVCEMGHVLDATHPMFQSHGDAEQGWSAATATKTELDLDLNAGARQPSATAPGEALDFDFSFPPEMAARIAASTHRPRPPAVRVDEHGDEHRDDFDDDTPLTTAQSQPALGKQVLRPRIDWDALNLDMDSPDEEIDPGTTTPADDTRLEEQLSRAIQLCETGEVTAAQSLAAEVAAKAGSPLKDRAIRFLATLS
jgi:pilus assembly protein FimV